MNEIILKQLKNKFGNLGFTDKAFEGVANFLAPTITDESEIENSISNVEGLLKAFQGDTDKRVAEAISKAKQQQKQPESQPPTPQSKNEEVPEWAKDLINANKSLSEKLNSFEQEKRTNDFKLKVQSKFSEEKIPSQFIKSFEIQEGEDESMAIERILTTAKNDYNEVKSSIISEGNYAQPKPLFGSVAKGEQLTEDEKIYLERLKK